jgi:hypothetical protein
LNGTVSADQLAFVDRRHVDIADLRAASADLINLYLQFELVGQWGTGVAAVADGTHFEIYEDNLLAEHHIRYGKTGGIAYRHIADNYIALFSRFIACGTYEATYILDALLENLSDLHTWGCLAPTLAAPPDFGLIQRECKRRVELFAIRQPRGHSGRDVLDSQHVQPSPIQGHRRNAGSVGWHRPRILWVHYGNAV